MSRFGLWQTGAGTAVEVTCSAQGRTTCSSERHLQAGERAGEVKRLL